MNLLKELSRLSDLANSCRTDNADQRLVSRLGDLDSSLEEIIDELKNGENDE